MTLKDSPIAQILLVLIVTLNIPYCFLGVVDADLSTVNHWDILIGCGVVSLGLWMMTDTVEFPFQKQENLGFDICLVVMFGMTLLSLIF